MDPIYCDKSSPAGKAGLIYGIAVSWQYTPKKEYIPPLYSRSFAKDDGFTAFLGFGNGRGGGLAVRDGEAFLLTRIDQPLLWTHPLHLINLHIIINIVSRQKSNF